MAEKILYFECRSGISGDMTVAALLDLGADEQQLRDALAGLPVHGYELEIGRRCSYGLAGCAFNVLLETAHCHHHDHDHAGDGEHHHHEHRNLQDILSLIGNARLTPRAREIAERTFRIVAEAEARAHGVGVEQVHFHEVGAVDSIVDIVAAAVCIDQLGVDRVVFSELTEGSGTVHCQHGELPVPVPAVLNIAAAHGLVLRRSETRGEMVTPTGAALAAALGEGVLPERFRIERTGVGVGSRDFGHPNILRAMLLTPVRETAPDSIWVLESNIDDATGEMLGLAMEKLFSAGARDVHFIPVS